MARRDDGAASDTDFGPWAPAGDDDLEARHAAADQRYLRLQTCPEAREGDVVTVADLFCGLGSLSLGVLEAARALGMQARLELAADLEQPPLDVLAASLPNGKAAIRRVDLARVLAGTGAITAAERAFLKGTPDEIDVVVAGPPCQGHSRLNNHTRHDDPRNDLYGRVARFVELRKPKLCVIENVDSIVNDQRRSATLLRQRLEELEYDVDEATVALARLGVPQIRRRHVLVATRAGTRALDVERTIERFAVPLGAQRDLRWAIDDLRALAERQSIDTPSQPSAVNQERIDWLHDEDEDNLPNERRPDCHRLPKRLESGEERMHSYRSMYGRLAWDKPAQTITSGFGSMGQGRYVHPSARRTLTAHEAARLQFIPDFFAIGTAPGRGDRARMIGNAAPMKLSYALALDFFR